MPWYDYRCENCTHAFEAQLPVQRRDEASCPKCGSRRLVRAMPHVYALVKTEKGRQAVAQDECCGGAGEGCACACQGLD